MKTNQTGNRIRLGIFLSTAIALFIIVIYFIGDGKHMFTKTFHISGTFKDLGGLEAGNNVRLTGINVGTIAGVEIITDSTVRVDMVIEKKVQKFIKKDAIATIGSEGLMGNKVINLTAGTAGTAMIGDGGDIKTFTPVSLDDIMRNLEITTRNAAFITADISILTASVVSGEGAIGKLFMDSSFAQTLDQTLVNTQNAAGGFSQNMEALKHNILLRGYYKKKAKEAEKAKDDKNEKSEKNDKNEKKEAGKE